MTDSPSLEAIIPLGPETPTPWDLIEVLHKSNVAITISAVGEPSANLPDGVKWVSGTQGRGLQLNRGIESCDTPWLWMIHADTRLPANAPKIVMDFVDQADWVTIGYCRLAFYKDGPWGVRLNQCGANLRSRWLDQPYGDQALCAHRQLWSRLGGFRDDLVRGEDLDFVIRARRLNAKTKPLPITLWTSAERYKRLGWFKTTLDHQVRAWRLVRQAKRWNP